MNARHPIFACFLMAAMLTSLVCKSQELYVFTEPASNMPAHSVSTKLTGRFFTDDQRTGIDQRYTPEVMLGLNGRWMLHGALTFSNMFSSRLRPESQRVYAKYRVYSNDEVHRHFRLAVFAEAAHSRNAPQYEELSLDGDQSGALAGLVVTQLLGKLALSSTLSYVHAMTPEWKDVSPGFVRQAASVTASAGYLLLPRVYSNFRQTNVNLYLELLAQRAIDRQRYMVDLAPAIQFIFNSNFKVNAGYRFQVSANESRMSTTGLFISLERTFLGSAR